MPGDVALERLAVEQVPLRRPARRIADHPGPAADERDRPAAEALEPEQPEDRHEVPDVERGAGRIEPDVARDRRVARQSGGQSGCRRVQDAAPLELVEQPAAAPRARPSQAATSSRLDLRTGGQPLIHAPYAIVRP